MSSNAQSPDPWPPEAPQPSPESTGAQYGSEFLSEASSEFLAVRQAIADAPPAQAQPSAPFLAPPPVSSQAPQALIVATARDLPAPADGRPVLRRALPGALLAVVVVASAAVWWMVSRPTPVLTDAVTTADTVSPAPAGAVGIDGRSPDSAPPGGSDAVAAAAPAGTSANIPPPTRREVAAPSPVEPASAPVPPPTFAAAPRPVAAPAREVSVGGWVALTSPIELQVFEGGREIGTTGSGRLPLAAGRHELVLVSDAFEVRTTVASVVTDGRVTALPVTLPTGRLSINALPWADVWVDDRPLGSTPLANVEVPVGDHRVVWRHPDLGERQQTVRVGAATPVRTGVDLSR